MDPVIFTTLDNRSVAQVFVRWQFSNPTGYVDNHKTTSSGMLHEVGCSHIGPPGDWTPDWGDLSKTPKVCHSKRGALQEWARSNRIRIDVCSNCIR